jgi:DNA-binding winged helix-turn-helix (wHTH) protein
MAVSQLRPDDWRSQCSAACRAERLALLRLIAATTPSVVQTGALRIDRVRQTVYVGTQEIATTPREWAILDFLAARIGQAISTTEIMAVCWGTTWADDDPHTVRVNMSRLRFKLGGCGPLIESVWRRGYRLAAARPDDNAPVPPLARPWAKGWDRCQECGTTEIKHGGHGRCTGCYDRGPWRAKTRKRARR